MILSDEEKTALNKIASLSMKDKNVVKDVLFSLLTYCTMDSKFTDQAEIVIPYVGKLKFKYKEENDGKKIISKVNIEAESSQSIVKEFVAIKNGETPPSKKYFQKQNRLHLQSLLKMEID